jgi:hypothetical protein
MLELSVPRTDIPQPGKISAHPGETTDWLERLPFASPIDAAQQLAMALYTLNRRPLASEARLTLLALYRPVVARAAGSLEALLLEAGVPPHQQQRQIGVLLRELHNEHAIGYKQAVHALVDGRPGIVSSPRLVEAASCLLAALHDLQAACYLTYVVPPAELWAEMHRVYRFARTRQIENRAGENAPALETAYRQALLLALADPPRMSPTEIMHARQIIRSFVHRTALGPAPADARAGFAIPLDSDAPPHHLAGTLQDATLWLDTDGLCRHLRDVALRLRADATPAGVGLPAHLDGRLCFTLIKRLARLWGPGARREFKRHAAPGSTVELVAGVSATHRLLEQAQHDPAAEADLAISDATLPLTPSVNSSSWTVVNDSASGLALSGAPDAPLNLKVGDPVALRPIGNASDWAAGAIRWIRMRDARQVELGIERLAPSVQPVWVRPLRGRRKASPEPALFLPGVAALKQGDRLLLPRYIYQKGMDAEVWHPPRQYLLTFGRCLEHTAAFDLVEFNVFVDKQAPE